MTTLRPFQRRFVAAVLRPDIKRAALSIPRGNGKGWLAGYLGAEAMRPGGGLFDSAAEKRAAVGEFRSSPLCVSLRKRGC